MAIKVEQKPVVEGTGVIRKKDGRVIEFTFSNSSPVKAAKPKGR